MAWQSPYDSPYPNAGPHSPMNGFKDQNLDEDAFGPAPGNIVSAFDAFRTPFPSPRLQQNTGASGTNTCLVAS